VCGDEPCRRLGPWTSASNGTALGLAGLHHKEGRDAVQPPQALDPTTCSQTEERSCCSEHWASAESKDQKLRAKAKLHKNRAGEDRSLERDCINSQTEQKGNKCYMSILFQN